MANEYSGRGERRGDRKEGVRIIAAEEAQAALEAGQATDRRHGDGFGDVPAEPSGPRPQSERDSVAGTNRAVTPEEAHDPRPWDARTPHAEATQEHLGMAEEVATSEAPADMDETKQQASPVSEEGSEWPTSEESPPISPSIWDDPAARPWISGGSPPSPPSTLAEPPEDHGSVDAGTPVRSEPDPAQQGPPARDEDIQTSEPASVNPAESPERPLPPLQEAIIMSGGSETDMPHWTDPPTGEVPRNLGGSEPEHDEDFAAWRALGTRGVRWREEGDDWDDAPLDDLGDEETRVGAMDTARAEHSDLYSFDEDFSRLEEERSGGHPVVDDPEADYEEASMHDPEVVESSSSHRQDAPTTYRQDAPTATRTRDDGDPPAGGSSRNLGTRVVVGLGLLALLFVAWAVGPKALVVLAAAVVVAASAEAYGMLQRSGFRPATLLALVVTAGTMFGAYWKGLEALPLGCALLFVSSMLWYLLGIVEARPLANVAVTTMTYLWIGLLGSFAALLLRQPHGAGLFVGPVFCAVAADIAAFAVGGRLGSRSLAPSVSPSKTIEGLLAGLVASVVVGAIIGKELTPWAGVRHGLLLGVVVGIVAPVGDLFESMVKRDLNIKDSGTMLRGHGGLLDRFDSILLVLPAAYYLASWFHL